MLNRIVAALIGIALLLSPVFSQERAPSAQDETIKIATASVQIDVIVTDKSGRRVAGLTPADFQVVDEGTPRTIDYFTNIEASHVVAQTPQTAAGAGSGSGTPQSESQLAVPFPARHIALVLDDLNLSYENFGRARRALTDYIDTKLSANDMVALISTGGTIASLQQFTTDHQRLLAALKRVSAQIPDSARHLDDRYRMTAAEAIRIDAGDESVLDAVARRIQTESLANSESTGSLARDIVAPQPRGARQSGEGNLLKNEDPGSDPLKAQLKTRARSQVAEAANQARITVKTLTNLIKAMAELPGRKIAVILTESFTLLTGTGEDQNQQIIQLIDLARRSGVSIYGLDAAGLRTNATEASQYTTGESLRAADLAGSLTLTDFEKLGALRMLVAGTGGALFAGTNDIASGLQRAVEDSNSYYVLGFKPSALDNKFHRLEITVKGKPGVIVRTRRGYLAINRETVKGTDAELLEALMKSPVSRLDLPVEVVANVVPKGGEQVVLVGLHVGRNYLAVPDPLAASQTAGFDVMSYVFLSGHDQPVGGVVRTITYDFAKDPDSRQKLKTEGLVVVKDFTQLPPGYYQVRAVVREKNTGAIGSSYQFFEIPDVKMVKEPSLSSLVLSIPGQPGFRGYNNFKRTSEVELNYLIYNLPKQYAELTQNVKILDNQDALVLDSNLPINGQTAAGSPGEFPQATRLRMPNARGRFSLIVTLHDNKGKIDLERRTDFVVE
ncbi:MAG TPA: VWA domain-containing protein [Pyrinomonadaceae bacterium]|nr:VWA domain-containing protein [Pyrinomonadaceae bacterium]